ncbi:MAG: 1-acyl-sn-glycerol-3-phosphate acyltransferase [Deltaproteobacteria bacterium]|nr:1-acyl-sn-glycerol-3-phosphate acyltransferase [Deltaproteobacteria bacterium]
MLSPLLLLAAFYHLATIGLDYTLYLTLLYFFLSLSSLRHHRALQTQLSKLIIHENQIHPKDFFDLYYEQLSPWPKPLAKQGFTLINDLEQDYRQNKQSKKSFLSLIKGSLSTITLARMAMRAFKNLPAEKARQSFDALARLWGRRISQQAKLQLKTLLPTDFSTLEGKVLLIYNHASTLDFCLNFAALASVRVKDSKGLTRPLRPRFIAARDHFIDNPLIYSWLGVGKAIQKAGMIFINRRQKGQGWAAMQEAATKLCQKEVEIAVYPQGTRAHAIQNLDGSIWEAGYYSTFNEATWDKPLGHLKIGTAQLILDSLLELKKQGQTQLTILSTGIWGAGSALAKGHLKIKTQSSITYRVGKAWILKTQDLDQLKKPKEKIPQNQNEENYLKKIQEIQIQLNQKLLEALDWHLRLLEKTKKTLNLLNFETEKTKKLIQNLEQAQSQEQSFPFILLDRLFSLPKEEWKLFFEKVFQLQEKNWQEPAWKNLLKEISQKLSGKKLI